MAKKKDQNNLPSEATEQELSLEEQIAQLETERKGLAEEAKALDQQLGRETELAKMRQVNQALNDTKLKQRAISNRLAVLNQDLGLQRKGEALVRLNVIRERKREILEEVYGLQKEAGATLHELYRTALPQLHRLNAEFGSIENEEGQLCKAYGFMLPQVKAQGRADVSTLGGSPIPEHTWAGFEKWLLSILAYREGRGSIYSPEEVWQE